MSAYTVPCPVFFLRGSNDFIFPHYLLIYVSYFGWSVIIQGLFTGFSFEFFLALQSIPDMIRKPSHSHVDIISYILVSIWNLCI